MKSCTNWKKLHFLIKWCTPVLVVKKYDSDILIKEPCNLIEQKSTLTYLGFAPESGRTQEISFLEHFNHS